MASSLSKLVNNLADGVDKLKYKYEQKNMKRGNKYIKISSVFLNTQT